MVGKYAKKGTIGWQRGHGAKKLRMAKGNVCFPVYAKEREKEKMIIFFAARHKSETKTSCSKRIEVSPFQTALQEPTMTVCECV